MFVDFCHFCCCGCFFWPTNCMFLNQHVPKTSPKCTLKCNQILESLHFLPSSSLCVVGSSGGRRPSPESGAAKKGKRQSRYKAPREAPAAQPAASPAEVSSTPPRACDGLRGCPQFFLILFCPFHFFHLFTFILPDFFVLFAFIFILLNFPLW